MAAAVLVGAGAGARDGDGCGEPGARTARWATESPGASGTPPAAATPAADAPAGDVPAGDAPAGIVPTGIVPTETPAAPAVQATGTREPETASPAAAPAATPCPLRIPGKPGAASIGDRYFPGAGNGGYDATRYRVALRFTPAGHEVDATVTMTATATQALSSFHLDFRGPRILDVKVDGMPAAFVRKGGELVVTPAGGLAAGKPFTSVVRYSGTPAATRDGELGTYGWVRSGDGAVVVAEPDGAPNWFPVNDHPSDKALYDFSVTVPKALQVVANGVPDTPVTKAGWTTYGWHERTPMASYLATVAIGKFAVKRGKIGDLPVITAVDPRFKKSLNSLHKTTIKALVWEQKLFGRYPFRSAGGIIDDPKLDYALETQSRPVYAGFAPDADFVVHELAHQWFGDSVSLRRWQDIWLNEGFATYAEWLWHERGPKTAGRDSAKKIFKRYYRQPPNSPIFNPPPGAPGRKALFSFSVYIRGAMTLQALRQRVGDKAFFKILRTWATGRRGGNATTADFIALSERISGRQLDKLFTVWLTRKGKPKKGSW
ncbi:M1 family metallopeptidase [Actinocorallia longicatena]|uniref:Aminopeptidase N n=1 Tax=Actinocorallia longicatena TaxID=111803 RepID=A0ABP6Q4P0_9ACTN